MLNDYQKQLLSEISKDLCCPICKDLIIDARVLPCGHCFCKLVLISL